MRGHEAKLAGSVRRCLEASRSGGQVGLRCASSNRAYRTVPIIGWCPRRLGGFHSGCRLQAPGVSVTAEELQHHRVRRDGGHLFVAGVVKERVKKLIRVVGCRGGRKRSRGLSHCARCSSVHVPKVG